MSTWYKIIEYRETNGYFPSDEIVRRGAVFADDAVRALEKYDGLNGKGKKHGRRRSAIPMDNSLDFERELILEGRMTIEEARSRTHILPDRGFQITQSTAA